ncbi:hypothetical protein PHJA_000504400 [Phtheirospermum japonicum]|uniref:Uncharacterized protein n=1 Tax=Phtheirospermum japonicum TaxID=374723 RepID=A0A830B7F6_9LAMI|nr:hypothetical protein PHJA_000504400 [Phtheirospermum japonicum]
MCRARRRKRSWRRGTTATRCAAAASAGMASPSSRRCPRSGSTSPITITLDN